MPKTKSIYKQVSQTRFSEAETHPRTGTLGFGHVDGKTAFTAAAHGRAVFGAFGTSFGRTVRAIAYVGCARQGKKKASGKHERRCLTNDKYALAWAFT